MVAAGRPCWDSKMMTKRKATRCGPCRSQGQPAGQVGLAYTFGGTHTSGDLVGSTMLWKASATREATSLGAIPHRQLRAEPLATRLVGWDPGGRTACTSSTRQRRTPLRRAGQRSAHTCLGGSPPARRQPVARTRRPTAAIRCWVPHHGIALKRSVAATDNCPCSSRKLPLHFRHRFQLSRRHNHLVSRAVRDAAQLVPLLAIRRADAAFPCSTWEVLSSTPPTGPSPRSSHRNANGTPQRGNIEAAAS
jgi:hypothetical protein